MSSLENCLVSLSLGMAPLPCSFFDLFVMSKPSTEPGRPRGAEVLRLSATRGRDLFPAHQLGPQHRAAAGTDGPVIWRLANPRSSAFGRRVLDAVGQIFAQTDRRHRRLPIEDDEFFHADRMPPLGPGR